MSYNYNNNTHVHIANYMQEANNDLRAAIILAHTKNSLPNTTFILPTGTFQWTAGTTFAPRNNTNWSFYGCTIELDMAGATSGQQFIFLRTDSGISTHPDRIQIWGGRFRILNVVTSFFSAAIQFEASSNCVIKDATAETTFHASATEGKIRWGFNLLGGDQTVDITQGRNNRFENCTLKFAQIQGCASGRSVDGVTIINTQVDDANDLAISVVSTLATQSVQNVSVINTQCRNAGGSGIVFVGSDGAGTGFGAGIVRNIIVDGVWLDGERSTPDLDFPYTSTVIVNGGLVTENIVVTNIGTKLAPNATLQARSIIIQSQDDEVNWHGLTVSNCDLGVVTTNDPLEALFIAGRNITGVQISNINVRGARGIRITDCDKMVISNVITEDGSLLILASSRNLTGGINISNSNLTRPTGFNTALQFTSVAARSMSKVMLSNLILNCNVSGLGTSLGGGTMQMWCDNIENTSNSNPSVETVAGIIRTVNIRGFVITTTVSVVVPAVLDGQVGYVNTSMAGTRLSDLAIGENIVANPTADLVAAGAGGGYINCRVESIGSVRLAFVGPLAGGASNFSFCRAAS